MALHLTKGVKLKVWKNKSLVMFLAKVDGRLNAKQCDDNNRLPSEEPSAVQPSNPSKVGLCPLKIQTLPN